MRKNFKLKVFGMIMCAVMMVTSVATFAGSSSGEFGSSEARAYAQLECTNGNAKAKTTPLSSGVSVSTTVTCKSHLGNNDTGYASGSGWAYASVSDGCSGAESRHTSGGFTYYLSCYNSV